MNNFSKKTIYSLLGLLTIILINNCASLPKSMMLDSHIDMTCGSCHEGKPEQITPNLKYPPNPSRACVKCHDYLKQEDHHPSEIALDSAVEIPSHFKLYNGKMECLTCHQVHSGGEYQSGTPNLLVGGHYSYRRNICFQCHDREQYDEINPHESMLKEDKTLNYSTCVICHSERPDPRFDRTRDVKFKAEIHFLCLRCHPPMPGKFFANHFLKESDMQAIDDLGVSLGTGSDTFDLMKMNERHSDILLPLDPKERITCSTCHNPHQPGVMVDKKAAIGAGGNKRLRFKDICIECHTSRRRRK